MIHYPKNIQAAIQALSRLPGVGTKTAERLVFFILRMKKSSRQELSAALATLETGTTLCATCGYVTENAESLCAICKDEKRDAGLLCVVADVQNVQAIEKTNSFHGKYHVLGGAINPIEGVSADMLSIGKLVERIQSKNPKIHEVILATGTDIEGEQTALYVSSALKAFPVSISRIARGIPRGSNLEYTDELTLGDAISERRKLRP
jgi:recombination protein RecR